MPLDIRRVLGNPNSGVASMGEGSERGVVPLLAEENGDKPTETIIRQGEGVEIKKRGGDNKTRGTKRSR